MKWRPSPLCFYEMVLPRSPGANSLGAMLAEAEVTALHRRWRAIACAVIASLPLIGVDESEVVVSGTPPRLSLASWGEIALAEGPRAAQVLIRCQRPGKGLLVASLDGTDAEVVADIIDCAGGLLHRRQRRVDADRAAVEAELADIATSTGWICTGVGGKQAQAAFRSYDDRVRGWLLRSDRADGDPSRATFTVTAEFGSLSYAQALAVLGGVQRAIDPIWKGQKNTLPIAKLRAFGVGSQTLCVGKT